MVPCLNDCGPYGQCLLLRRHGYLYAGCSCKAGEDQAWMPPDNAIIDFSALCLPLGAHPTLSRLESTLTEQEQMPSPYSCHTPPPCKHRKAPPQMVSSDLGLLCPHLPTDMSHTCPIPAPHLPHTCPTHSYTCLIPLYTCPCLPHSCQPLPTLAYTYPHVSHYLHLS